MLTRTGALSWGRGNLSVPCGGQKRVKVFNLSPGAYKYMFRILYILIVLSTSLLWRSASQADVALVDMFAKTPSVEALSDSETDKFVALRSTKIEDKEAPRNGLTIAWVVIPAHDYFFTIKDVRKVGDANGIFSEIECAGSPVFVNGGFYRYDDSTNRRIPMGLVVASGTKFSPVWKWKTGGALFDGPKEKTRSCRSSKEYRSPPKRSSVKADARVEYQKWYPARRWPDGKSSCSRSNT